MNLIIVKFPAITICLAFALGIFLSTYVIKIDVLSSYLISSSVLLLIIAIEYFIEGKNNAKTFLIIFSVIIVSLLINSSRVNLSSIKDYSKLNVEVEIKKLFGENSKFQNCIVEDVSNYKNYLARISRNDSSEFSIGTRLYINSELTQINKLEIPNNFNFKKYLHRKGVDNSIEIKNYVRLNDEKKISQKIEDKIKMSQLSLSSKGFMNALILGRKDGIPDETIDSFSDSGIMHLLALSGLHIGILTLILTFILKPLKFLQRGKLIRSLVVVALLWYYTYITGFSSSIVRATIMFSVIVIGHGMRRQVNIYNSLSIAALVLLIIDPNYLFDVGFQLSFTAVIGIVWIFPLLNKVWKPKNKIANYFWSLLLVSIAAQIATFPITLFYFHKFSGLFFVANIFEIPLITILLAFSYFLLMLLLLGYEYSIVNYIYDKTVILIEFVSMKISTLENLVFEDIFIDEVTVVLSFMLIISLVSIYQFKNIKYLYVVLITVIFIQISIVIDNYNKVSIQKIMIAKGEVIIQYGEKYNTNRSEQNKIFSNYILAEGLVMSNDSLKDIFHFNNNYYWKVIRAFDINPIHENHFLIIDNNTKSNPEIMVSTKTLGVLYSGYSNSNIKNRWEYFCNKINLDFYNTNDSLFVDEYKSNSN